ncbi:unnamed protein product [Ixodes pacificus]
MLYVKGVKSQEMFPPKASHAPPCAYIPEMAVKMNSAQGLMLRAFLKLQDNSRHHQEVVPRIGWSFLCFSSPECVLDDIENVQTIMLDADECDSVAETTVLQSLCPEWHLLRKERLFASSKSRRICVREAVFEEFAHDLRNQKKLSIKSLQVWHRDGAHCKEKIPGG